MLTVSFPITAVAQSYVYVKKDTKSRKGVNFYEKSLLPFEVDSTDIYIEIIEKNQYSDDGIEPEAVFKVTKYDPNIMSARFDSHTKKDRSGAFKQARYMVKYGDDYIPYESVEFIPNDKIGKNAQSDIRKEIISKCTYDKTAKKIDFADCKYDYIYKKTKFTDKVLYNVEPDAEIQFILERTAPLISINVADFKTSKESYNVEPDSEGTNWFNEYWIYCVIALCLLAITVVIWLKNRRESDGRVSHHKDNGEKQNHVKTGVVNRENSKSLDNFVVGDDLHKDIKTMLQSMQSAKTAIENQTRTLDSIKSLVSNTDERKQLVKKTEELEIEKKKYVSAIAERDKALSEIEKLKGDIAILQAGSQIEGVIQVSEYSTFVSFAKKVLSECFEAENLVIKYWSSLNSIDQHALNGFLSNFQMTKCSIELSKWNGIIATLDLKGYVKNDEYITYLTPLSDKDRMKFLNKRFFEDILRPFVGAIILFLEQIRTANKIGVSAVCNENIDGYINSICTKCHEQGVFVDYRKLYEKVTEYDSLEILELDENIPENIKKVIAKVEEEDILLYVDKYAVNLKSGEMPEKTRCYIKI